MNYAYGPPTEISWNVDLPWMAIPAGMIQPDVGDVFWVAVCHPTETPDGPAKFVGPYTSRELAEFDIHLATHPPHCCLSAHYVGHHRWTHDMAERMRINSFWRDELLMDYAATQGVAR